MVFFRIWLCFGEHVFSLRLQKGLLNFVSFEDPKKHSCHTWFKVSGGGPQLILSQNQMFGFHSDISFGKLDYSE